MLDRTYKAELVEGTLVVRGDIDDYGIISLRNLLAEHATAPGGVLMVDLNAVDYLPSVAVGVLTRAMAAARHAGGDLVLVADRGTVAQRVLHLCALPYRESDDDGVEPPDADLPA